MENLKTLLLSTLSAGVLALGSLTVHADELERDAAIGGAIGGAVGGYVGAQTGDRNTAVLGSAVGAAIGSSVATRNSETDNHKSSPEVRVDVEHHRHEHESSTFCPPGQAKKGRC